MNKKLRELLAEMEQKRNKAKHYREDGDLEKASTVLDELDALQKEYEVEKRLFEADTRENEPTDDQVNDVNKDDEPVDGFVMIAKQLNKKRLTEKENALLVGGESGEDYLIPEDVQLQINELRRQYESAKDIVTVTSRSTLSGTTNWEAGELVGLTKFTDGDAIDQSGRPKFEQKKWAIEFAGKIIPVSNILQGAEKAGLMSYLDRWFVKNAVLTENTDIFTELKRGKSVKALQGWEQLKRSINVDLDPALLNGAVIATNQTGFATLDEEKDENGRPILTPDPTNPTRKLFQGLPIRIFTDAQLPNVGAKAPIFYGNTKAGVEFQDYQALQFATSNDFLFNYNQTAIRVIEGYDVTQLDTDAYIYGTFEATPAPVDAGE